MRLVTTIVALALLTGCASNEYSKVPEPTGEWVPANPTSLMAEQATPPAPPQRGWGRRVPSAMAAR